VEVVFEEAVDSGASGALAEAGAEVGEVFGGARGDDFNVAVFGVADPAGESEFAGLAVDKPAEADTLYATLHKKMKDHGV
jgi:hypothetical protein